MKAGTEIKADVHQGKPNDPFNASLGNALQDTF